MTTLQEAHDLLEQILNSRLAPAAFGAALLLTGQMSTFTGTIAGQVRIRLFTSALPAPECRPCRLRSRVVSSCACMLSQPACSTLCAAAVQPLALATCSSSRPSSHIDYDLQSRPQRIMSAIASKISCAESFRITASLVPWNVVI